MNKGIFFKNRYFTAITLLLSILISTSLESKAQGTQIPVGPHMTNNPGNVRGYYFTAPANFTICGLFVETGGTVLASDFQTVEVVRFTAGPPPAYSAVTNSFVSLFYEDNWAPNTPIPCNIQVNAGDIIGVYGARSNGTLSSYSTPNYATTILGNPVTLIRSGMQFPLWNQQMHDIWSEAANSINRITMTINCCNAVPPTVPVKDFTFCQGETTSAQVVATGGPNLTWRDKAGNVIPSAPTINTSTPVKDTFYVSTTGTDPVGCESQRIRVTITVHPKPNPPTITGQTNYCLNDPFIPFNVTGSNVLWYSVPVGGTPSATVPTVNTSIPGTYTWYVVQSVNGCNSDRVPFTVTVAIPPPPPLVESPVVYCRGDEATPLLAGGQNLKWYKSSTGGLGSTVAPTPQTGAESFTSWYVSQTVNGCEGARARIDVKIVEKPNVLIQSSAEGLCQGEELTLNYYGSGLPTYAYNWGLPTGASLTSGTGMGPITVKFDSAGVQKVTLQVGNEGCYSGIGIKNINVKPLPEGYINAAYNVCQDAVGLVVLDSYSPSIDTFRWDFDGGVMIHEHQDVGPYGVRWSQPGQHIIKLTVKNEECTAILYDTVMVRPLPDASFSGVPSEPVCAGDSLKLTANTIDPASSYQWKPAGFFDNYDQQSSTYARIDFMGPVSLTVTDEFGCVKTDSVMIKTQNCCIVSFPSAFTPNGDGRNDYFHPITTAHLNIKSFKVVNRWGQAVFETAEQSMGWDGTMSGEKLDMGTYFYFISYQCNGIATEQRGEVTLIR